MPTAFLDLFPLLTQIMDLLGSSLWDVWNQEGQQLSAQFVACVAVEAITILEALHQKGYEECGGA